MPPDFEQVVNQNMGRIRRVAKRYANNEEGDDLTQEILVALWRSFDRKEWGQIYFCNLGYIKPVK